MGLINWVRSNAILHSRHTIQHFFFGYATDIFIAVLMTSSLINKWKTANARFAECSAWICRARLVFEVRHWYLYRSFGDERSKIFFGVHHWYFIAVLVISALINFWKWQSRTTFSKLYMATMLTGSDTLAQLQLIYTSEFTRVAQDAKIAKPT